MTFRQLRLMRELTQSDLAKSVGITAHAISQYELGLRTPNLKISDKLAKALNVDLQIIVDCFMPTNGLNKSVSPLAIKRKKTNSYAEHKKAMDIFTFSKLNDAINSYDLFLQAYAPKLRDELLLNLYKDINKVMEYK